MRNYFGIIMVAVISVVAANTVSYTRYGISVHLTTLVQVRMVNTINCDYFHCVDVGQVKL